MISLHTQLQKDLKSGRLPPTGTLLVWRSFKDNRTIIILDYFITKDSDGFIELENEIICVKTLGNYNSRAAVLQTYTWNFIKQFETISVPIS